MKSNRVLLEEAQERIAELEKELAAAKAEIAKLKKAK